MAKQKLYVRCRKLHDAVIQEQLHTEDGKKNLMLDAARVKLTEAEIFLKEAEDLREN